jgi:hypothetical protein
MTEERAFVEDFAFQIPIWIVLPILVAVALGVWKLVKFVMAAVHD